MKIEAILAELTTALKRAHALSTVGELLGWDEQVNLPAGAAEQRAGQQAALAEAQHTAASDPRIGGWLTTLEAAAAGLTEDQRTVLQQARKDYDRATKLPAEFVREKATQGSRGYHAWAAARAADDFAGYAPVLEKNLELAKREAAFLGWKGREYDYMIDKHDPGMTADVIGRLFAELKRELVPLVREIAASKVKPQTDRLRGFPVEGQMAFLREVTAR
ncbi:MAG: carboxypeptidase M32, partial [Opitutaceae bacterium]